MGMGKRCYLLAFCNIVFSSCEYSATCLEKIPNKDLFFFFLLSDKKNKNILIVPCGLPWVLFPVLRPNL